MRIGQTARARVPDVPAPSPPNGQIQVCLPEPCCLASSGQICLSQRVHRYREMSSPRELPVLVSARLVSPLLPCQRGKSKLSWVPETKRLRLTSGIYVFWPSSPECTEKHKSQGTSGRCFLEPQTSAASLGPEDTLLTLNVLFLYQAMTLKHLPIQKVGVVTDEVSR